MEQAMPLLTRCFIKVGLVYFVVALSMATLGLAQPLFNLPAWLMSLRPVYLHLLMVGWILQLIIGVVYWMFPKQSREHPRGNEQLGWMVFWMLNIGLLLRAFGEPLVMSFPQTNAGWVLLLSALLQLAAGLGFIANTWGRVKER
jgi:cbb3-type cytochrome oxidase subunit 1